MSFYRSIFATLAVVALASPVFADDAANVTGSADQTKAVQVADATGATSTDQQSTTETKIDINKATKKELTKVKGLNANKAKAIVAYRKKNGDFKSLDDLSKVKGFKKVKPDTLKEIQDQLTIN